MIASAVAIVCLGLAKGGFVGLGLLATPILMLSLPPLDAVAVLIPVMLAQDIFSVWAYRREYDPRNLRIMLPGVLIGITVAWLLLVEITHIRLLVGLTLLWLVITQTFGPSSHRSSPVVGTFWGVASGFAGLVSNAGSIGFLMYVFPQRLAPRVYAGTMAIFFAVVDLAKLPPFIGMRQFTQENLEHSAFLILPALAMNWIGIILVRRINPRLFYRLATALVFCIAVILIWQDWSQSDGAPRTE
jgi:hypothetical protein